MKNVLKYFKENPIVALLLTATLIMGLSVENFASWGNMSNLIANTTIRFVIALGVSGCLITKGTDLSAGRQVGLAGCIAGILIQRGDYTGRVSPFPEMNMWLILLIVVVIGAFIGYVSLRPSEYWMTRIGVMEVLQKIAAQKWSRHLVNLGREKA